LKYVDNILLAEEKRLAKLEAPKKEKKLLNKHLASIRENISILDAKGVAYEKRDDITTSNSASLYNSYLEKLISNNERFLSLLNKVKDKEIILAKNNVKFNKKNNLTSSQEVESYIKYLSLLNEAYIKHLSLLDEVRDRENILVNINAKFNKKSNLKDSQEVELYIKYLAKVIDHYKKPSCESIGNFLTESYNLGYYTEHPSKVVKLLKEYSKNLKGFNQEVILVTANTAYNGGVNDRMNGLAGMPKSALQDTYYGACYDQVYDMILQK